jgi:hypothetical protein
MVENAYEPIKRLYFLVWLNPDNVCVCVLTTLKEWLAKLRMAQHDVFTDPSLPTCCGLDLWHSGLFKLIWYHSSVIKYKPLQAEKFVKLHVWVENTINVYSLVAEVGVLCYL